MHPDAGHRGQRVLSRLRGRERVLVLSPWARTKTRGATTGQRCPGNDSKRLDDFRSRVTCNHAGEHIAQALTPSKRLAAGSSPAGGANLRSALPGYCRRSALCFVHRRRLRLCAPWEARKSRVGAIPSKLKKNAGQSRPLNHGWKCERPATGSSPTGRPKHGWSCVEDHATQQPSTGDANGQPAPDQHNSAQSAAFPAPIRG